jgi:hypothetical protein
MLLRRTLCRFAFCLAAAADVDPRESHTDSDNNRCPKHHSGLPSGWSEYRNRGAFGADRVGRRANLLQAVGLPGIRERRPIPASYETVRGRAIGSAIRVAQLSAPSRGFPHDCLKANADNASRLIAQPMVLRLGL